MQRSYRGGLRDGSDRSNPPSSCSIPTPPPPTNDITTPHTVCTLKRHSDAMLNNNLLHSALKTRLLPLLRGAQIHAVAGAEAVEESKDSNRCSSCVSSSWFTKEVYPFNVAVLLRLQMRAEWFKTVKMMRLRWPKGSF